MEALGGMHIMDWFENLDLPARPFIVPKLGVVEYDVEEPKNNQNADRTYSGKDYAIDEKEKLESEIAKSFSNITLNQSDLTRVSTILESTMSRSDLNSTNASTSTVDYNVKFAPNNHRKDLPIFDYRDAIIHIIDQSPVVIITGKTGSGKTTQIPQYIFDHWAAQKNNKTDCNILVSQPRKIAAITIAKRVAEERDSTVGELVGYQVGLKKEMMMDEQGGTKILYCTTGVILQKLVHDKSMGRYSHIIIDEIHERDINTDLLLIVIRRLFAVNNPKTKIILMSATVDVSHFKDYFKIPLTDGSYFFPPIIDLLHKPSNYSVTEFFLEDFQKFRRVDNEINYDEPGISEELYNLASRIISVCFRQMIELMFMKNGVILVFLPGLNEIENFYEKLKTMFEKAIKEAADRPTICVLHSCMSSEEQSNNLKPGSSPKIILSTNIAESSLTIPNVTHVIDFCLSKSQAVIKGAQLSTLILNWSSKQNCIQRAGRCGRMCNGNVIRLVSKKFYDNMDGFQKPEMILVGLETVILKVKVFNLGSPVKMLALAPDPPDMGKIVDSVLHLKELGGLSKFNEAGEFDYEDGKLTFLGRVMESLPMDPRIAKFVVMGYLFSVLDEAIIIGAGLNIKSIFVNNFGKRLLNYQQRLKWANGSASDCIAILNAYASWQITKASSTSAESKIQWCKRNGLDIKNIREMTLLIEDIKKRLLKWRIAPLPDQPAWTQDEKNFVLKICMAGAFGPSHFFLPTQFDQDVERDVFATVNNLDPFRTVVFRNMDRNLVGEVYEERLRAALIDKGVIEKETEVKFSFNYQSSEQIFMEFLRERDEEKEGKILPEAYKAVKFRQIDGKISFRVMDPAQTIEWAQKEGLGKLVEGKFMLKKNLIKAPQLCALPTVTVKTMEGVVTHIENGNKFFFMPEKAIHESVKGKFEDNSYKDNFRRIQTMMKLTEKEKIEGKVSNDKMLMTKIDGVWCRAFFRSQESKEEFRLNLIDVGSEVSVKIEDIWLIDNEAIEAELMRYPPCVFECTLAHIMPSITKSHDGKWSVKSTRVLRERVLDRKASIDIFSVVDNIVSVELMVDGVNVNKKLVQKLYANECEESYLSLLDNEDRRNLRDEEIKPEIEFAAKEEKTSNIPCKPPPLISCSTLITLKGPQSPLEVTLNSVSRFCNAKVNVDQNSVNSVILEDDISNPHSKFFVACDVTVNNTSKAFILRDVTMMPPTPGLAVILALIFCSEAELRRDSQKSRYVSLLTGLGFDKNIKQPYYGEHDACFNIDFKLDHEDINHINQLRLAMSTLLHAEKGQDFVNLNEGEKVDALTMIHESTSILFTKQRAFRAVEQPADSFDWLADDNDIVPRVDSFNRNGIFNIHNFPILHELPEKFKTSMKLHAFELVKASKGTVMFHRKECKLCGFTWNNSMELKLHLKSKKHINIVAELMD